MPRKKDDRAELLEFIEPYVQEWEARVGKRDLAFCNWATHQVLIDEDLSDEEIERVTEVGGGGDRGIDGWYYATDGPEPVLHLIQSKDTRPTANDVERLRLALLKPFDPAQAPGVRPALKARASEFEEGFLDGTIVHLHLVTSWLVANRLREEASAAPPVALFERELPCRVSVHDLRDLTENLRLSPDRPIDVELEFDPKEIFQMWTAAGFGTFAFALEGLTLARLFEKYRGELFRLNPRYWLSTRTAVNGKILETLRSDERRNFYLFNNGVTAICDSAKVHTRPDGRAVLNARNFQIVNGCQTTATLNAARLSFGSRGDVELSGVKVLVRVIESQQQEFIARRVVERTNSQNPMRAEDLRSNDDSQKRLHDEFAKLSPPWFYEHKRGVWDSLVKPTAEKQAYAQAGGGYRVIKIKDLAQAALAFLGDPKAAIEGPRAVFEKDERYHSIFPAQIQAPQLLLAHRLYLLSDGIARAEAATLPGSNYLRYPLLALVSRAAHQLAGVPEATYFRTPASRSLLEGIEKWAPPLMDIALAVLRDTATTAGENQVGLRSLVRQKDWLTKPQERFMHEVSRTLETETRAAEKAKIDPGDFGLRGAFPLPIKL